MLLLYIKQTMHPNFFFRGNDGKDGTNEAQAMKEMALYLGVSEEDILLEPASTSTYENLLFSEKFSPQNNLILFF